MRADEEIVLVDIGNSRLKWRLIQRGRTTGGESVPWGSSESLARLLERWRLLCPARVVASNVGGAKIASFVEHAVENIWGLSVGWITSRAKHGGVCNGYLAPARLGPDRWAALLGARQVTRGACVVVDCGSAITIDVLDSGGRHLGGLISPGLMAQHGALVNGTAELGSVAFKPLEAFGNNTAACVNAGVFLSAVGFIEKGVALAEQQVGETQRLITGGDAERLQSALGKTYRLEPELIFRGLALIAQDNLSSV